MGIVIQKIINNKKIFNPYIEPSSYSIQKSDVYSDTTGRSAETGVLLAYPVRRNICTIKLEYCGNDEEITYIENMIDNSLLEVTFWDSGNYTTKIMYPSDREKTAEIIYKRKGIYNLSFNLIEY